MADATNVLALESVLRRADGGYTDWTQRLSGNRKERFLISGLGLELLFKIISNFD